MTQATLRVDRWIHGFLPVTADGLAMSRIFFAAYVLLTGIPTFSWLSANPPGFFFPPPISVAAMFGEFPSAGVLRFLDLLICVLLIFLLVGFKTKTSSVLLSLAWIIGNSFRYSFGKIDHSILAVVTPAVMAFTGWGATLSVDAKRGKTATDVEAWPISLLALLVGFGFFSAGFPKLLSWADFDLSTQGVRNWLISGWYELDRKRLLAPFFMSVNNPYVWEAMDLMAVAFEVGFVFSLARRGSFRAFLFIAIMFHLFNLLMLNIAFLTLIPVYVMFVPWERLLPHMPQGVTRLVDRLASLRGMAALLVLFLPLYLLVSRISVDTAANRFSHLGIAFELMTTVDYDWTLSITNFPIAALIAIVLAGLPQPRRPASEMLTSSGKRIVFFDGVCNLCNGYVDFLMQRGRRQGLLFASLQSERGEIVRKAVWQGSVATDFQSILLVDLDGRIYERSDAILKILMTLGGPYRMLSVLWLVPRPIRDIFYRIVARWRYRVFGERKSCRIPTAEERAAFLE